VVRVFRDTVYDVSDYELPLIHAVGYGPAHC